MQKEKNQRRARHKTRTLTSALAEGLGIVAAVPAADSDTGFGRGNDPVDIEKDDVGSVVKKSPICAGAGFTYVQASQHQQDKRHMTDQRETGARLNETESACAAMGYASSPQDYPHPLPISAHLSWAVLMLPSASQNCIQVDKAVSLC